MLLFTELVNHYYVSNMLPDYFGVIVEKDRRAIRSDFSSLLDWASLNVFFVHIACGEFLKRAQLRFNH